jgi:hypothetical protein
MSTLAPNRSVKLQELTLAGAKTLVGGEVSLPFGTRLLSIESIFVRAAGGTTCKVYVQTSLDGGTTWIDIACHAFTTTTASKVSAVKADTAVTPATTPGDGALSDDTVLDGLLGDRIRSKVVSTGTYSGASSIKVRVVPN